MHKDILFEPDLEVGTLKITFYHKQPDDQVLEVWRTLDEDGMRQVRRLINELLERSD